MRSIIWLVSIVIFVIIVILPFLFMALDAVKNQPDIFQQLLQICFSERSLKLLFNSLTIALGATLVGLIVGLPLGFFIARTDIYLKGLLRYLQLLPLLIPAYISAIAWISLLGSSTIYGHWIAILILGLSYFPFISLLTISGLSTLDKRLEEQALLSASQWKVFLGITLPLILPFVIAGSLFVFVFSVSDYGVPALLRVNTYPLEIFAQFSAFYNPRLAVLSSFPLLFLTFALIVISYLIMKDKCYVSLEGTSKQPKVIELKGCRFISSLFVWLTIFLAGFLPLIILIISAGSISSYKVAVKTSLNPILTSLGLSFLGATLCVGLGFFLSFFIERAKSKFRTAIDMLSILPLAIPAIILGIGLIKLWNRPSTEFIYSGFLIVVFGFIARFIPFSVRIISSNFKQLNPNMEEAASLSGVGFFKTAFKILLPLTKTGILASWVICFIFCMSELATTLLVIPAGFETLSIKIYTLMHYGVGRLTSALCIILVLVTIIPVLFLGWIFKKTLIND